MDHSNAFLRLLGAIIHLLGMREFYYTRLSLSLSLSFHIAHAFHVHSADAGATITMNVCML